MTMGTRGRIQQAYRPERGWTLWNVLTALAWFVSYTVLFSALVYGSALLLAVLA
jgi:hypothetical protein